MPDQKTFEIVSVKSLLHKNNLVHLRLPFSFFLLPVFLFALCISDSISLINTIILFILLHFFIYPASNAYNSYMDKDTESIALLKNPPEVTKNLYFLSIILDLAGLALALLINLRLALMVSLYILISKLYSWNRTRLKRHGIVSWALVSFFQGGFTFLMVKMSAENDFDFFHYGSKILSPIFIASFLVGAIYPITQVYQHKQDIQRGDHTISSRLGIKGTFIFSGLSFIAGLAILFIYFKNHSVLLYFTVVVLCLLPAIIYFLKWFLNVAKDPAKANFRRTMEFNFIASGCMNIAFLIILFIKILD
jgi:1,4-dihydroxy-2-naphthoate octaprenyltransferase